jgi:hypothetical protein
MNDTQYFKVGPVDGNANSYYPYCDAPFSAAELWILEEVGTATGIEDIKDENGNVTGVYDLQGRKVENPSKGIYIINGKKTLIK